MYLLRPIHWYYSRADLIWPVGPFNIFFKCYTIHAVIVQHQYIQKTTIGWPLLVKMICPKIRIKPIRIGFRGTETMISNMQERMYITPTHLPGWFPANHKTSMVFSLPRLQAAWRWSVVDWAGAYGSTFLACHPLSTILGRMLCCSAWLNSKRKWSYEARGLHLWNPKMDGNKWFFGQQFLIICKKIYACFFFASLKDFQAPGEA
jgi:hypothetical protein